MRTRWIRALAALGYLVTAAGAVAAPVAVAPSIEHPTPSIPLPQPDRLRLTMAPELAMAMELLGGLGLDLLSPVRVEPPSRVLTILPSDTGVREGVLRLKTSAEIPSLADFGVAGPGSHAELDTDLSQTEEEALRAAHADPPVSLAVLLLPIWALAAWGFWRYLNARSRRSRRKRRHSAA